MEGKIQKTRDTNHLTIGMANCGYFAEANQLTLGARNFEQPNGGVEVMWKLFFKWKCACDVFVPLVRFPVCACVSSGPKKYLD